MSTSVCAHCAASKPLTQLKRCTACRSVCYCDQDCQKGHWSKHKAECKAKAKVDQPKESPNITFDEYLASLNLETTPDTKSILHGIPESLAFAYLIDSYRLRIEDSYVYRGEACGLYGGEDPFGPFFDYLEQARRRRGVMPDWWDKAARQRCLEMAQGQSGHHCIYHAVEKSDLSSFYKDPFMVDKLRGLAEAVEGWSPLRWDDGDEVSEISVETWSESELGDDWTDESTWTDESE